MREPIMENYLAKCYKVTNMVLKVTVVLDRDWERRWKQVQVLTYDHFANA